MKDAEDEAFDELAKRQGAWGGGFKAKQAMAADKLQEPAQEPVGWVDLQKKAQQIVESKFLWKRFIDGTPLANDIACWMADFARQYATPPQREWVGLTAEDFSAIKFPAEMRFPAEFRAGARWADVKLKEKNG